MKAPLPFWPLLFAVVITVVQTLLPGTKSYLDYLPALAQWLMTVAAWILRADEIRRRWRQDVHVQERGASRSFIAAWWSDG